MNLKRHLFALACGGLLALSARADKELNGGQSFDFEGRPSLRDLVDSSTCNWIPGTLMMSQQRHLPTVLEQMDRVHPLFSHLLLLEAERTDFCLTGGDLAQVKSEDSEGLTILANGRGRQLAIRVGTQIFVDSKIFERMSDVDRAYLMVHELLHGYLPHNVPQRNMKLRSFVAYLRKAELNGTDLNAFSYQTKMAELAWPTDVKMLALFGPSSTEFAVARDRTKPAAQRMQAALQLHEQMLVYPSKDLAFLAKLPGFETVREFVREEYRTFRQAVVQGNGARVLRMLESGEIPVAQVYASPAFDLCLLESLPYLPRRATETGGFALEDSRQTVLDLLVEPTGAVILDALVSSPQVEGLHPSAVLAAVTSFAATRPMILKKLLENPAFRPDPATIYEGYLGAARVAATYLTDKAYMELELGARNLQTFRDTRSLMEIYLTHPATAAVIAREAGPTYLFAPAAIAAISNGSWSQLPNPMLEKVRLEDKRFRQESRKSSK